MKEILKLENTIEGKLFGYKGTYKWRTGRNRRKKS
jgi:hypothetical protein